MQVEPAINGVQEDAREAGPQIMETINEEIVPPSGPNGKFVDLSLQIPPKPVGFGSSRNGKDLLESQDSSKGSLAPAGFLPSLSFKKKEALLDGEGSSLLNLESNEVPASPVLASFIAAFSWKRCVSLPVRPALNLSPSVVTPSRISTEKMPVEQHTLHRPAVSSKVSRSLSVPMRNVVIVRSASFATRREPVQTDISHDEDEISPIHMEEDDEEIPEEKAICRICFDKLCGVGTVFKMECSCKGDLTLTHEECTVKWFSIKGNNLCDVCGQEVRNLPVTVLRVQSSSQRGHRQERSRRHLVSQSISPWHDLVVLILISSISYFFIIEQLLVPDLKSQAIVIAAPFSFTLGLLGSMFALVLAIKEYMWTYAALEFALVSMILYVFYSFIHLSAVYSILLAALLGFGIAMCINSFYLYMYARRAQITQTVVNSNPA